MRDIGIFSWYGYRIPLRERLHHIAAHGFKATSIWYGEIEETYQDGTMGEQVGFARSLGLEIDYVHAPFEDCNKIWSDNPEERELIFTRYRDNILFCSENQIPIVVIHISMGYETPPFQSPGFDVIQRLLEMAEKSGVSIAIENTRKPALIARVLSEFDSPFMGLCYDSSHDRLWGDPIFSILEKFGHRLKTLHLSDNWGKNDDHLIPGRGIIHWRELLSILARVKYNGRLMLEVYPQNPEIESELEFLKTVKSVADLLNQALTDDRIPVFSD